ncbi:MAG TPA: hypothetical protein VGK99_16540 [Acidobacteriota bacterium]
MTVTLLHQEGSGRVGERGAGEWGSGRVAEWGLGSFGDNRTARVSKRILPAATFA